MYMIFTCTHFLKYLPKCSSITLDWRHVQCPTPIRGYILR